MLFSDYIKAENEYALSCIQVFVLLFDNKKINCFNYINLIFHLSCDLSKIYEVFNISIDTSAPPQPITSEPDKESLDYLTDIKSFLDNTIKIQDEYNQSDTDDDKARKLKITELLRKINQLQIQDETNKFKKNFEIKKKIKQIIDKLILLEKCESKSKSNLLEYNKRISVATDIATLDTILREIELISDDRINLEYLKKIISKIKLNMPDSDSRIREKEMLQKIKEENKKLLGIIENQKLLAEKIKQLNRYTFRGDKCYNNNGICIPVFNKNDNSLEEYYILNIDYSTDKTKDDEHLVDVNKPLFKIITDTSNVLHIKSSETTKLENKLKEIIGKKFLRDKTYTDKGYPILLDTTDKKYYIFNLSNNNDELLRQEIINPNLSLFKEINKTEDILVIQPNFYMGGGEKDNIKEVGVIYSTFLNIKSSPNDINISDKDIEEYKTNIEKDCNDDKYSDDYVNAILDLHKSFTTTLKDKIKTENHEQKHLNQIVALQLNLLSTVNINKCALYNFINFCNKKKGKKIYILEREQYISQIKK